MKPIYSGQIMCLALYVANEWHMFKSWEYYVGLIGLILFTGYNFYAECIKGKMSDKNSKEKRK